MKNNENKVNILMGENNPTRSSNLPQDKKSSLERLKKPLIFVLMGIVFVSCLYLIFKPTSDQNETQNLGLNDAVPQPAKAEMQSDKQKAYQEEMLEQKELQKRNALTSLSDYWNEDSSSTDSPNRLSDETGQNINSGNSPGRPANASLNSYRNTQSTLSSFYNDDNSHTHELRRQLDDLKEQLAQKDVPKVLTANDQMALMEKSYQMAAKYLPSPVNVTETKPANVTTAAAAPSKKEYFQSFTPVKKNTVSALYREPTDSTLSEHRNRSFSAAGSSSTAVPPKNSIKACIQETQTFIGEAGVRLRLLEAAQTSNGKFPKGALLMANGKFQAGRLQLKVTSIELDGHIIAVDLTVYDLDGQQGLYVPYSAEMNAVTEMAGNMSQTSGTSFMLTQSAGQQVAADLSRGVIQGVSGYFSKKIKTPKVILKAGHQVFLVSKK
ncbi:conjugative transposon protein TraM [Flavobacterium poyangense]|uniref:conjugative transposon protein TraM n=1 Tax=Flavobacterium poyangense TaxID=2204302 RepID=UPI001421BE9D|nr:conjugative transposon protein TraM [Flavobacterium sp. JXAS1]